MLFTSAKEDAVRRDFTINGLFYDPVKKEVLDFIEGQKDIKNKIIRFIGEPHERIKEDHLRLLRAVRFEHPDRIPIAMGINNACWHHYPQDALQALMVEHPILFPNFRPQPLPFTPTYAPWRVAGHPHTDSWSCVWETIENGITGAVSQPALPSWEAFATYQSPDPETQNGWAAQDWKQEAKRVAHATICVACTRKDVIGDRNVLTIVCRSSPQADYVSA